MFDVCTRRRWEFLYIHLHVKMKGMLLRFLFFYLLCFISITLPFFRHMEEGYRVREEHKIYTFMHSYNKVKRLLWSKIHDIIFPSSSYVNMFCCFFSLTYVCMCLSFSLSHSLLPPPSSNIFSSFIIIIEQKKNVDNTEVYISPNMFSFRTSSELSTAQTRKLNEGSICIEEWNFCLSVFSLKASNTEGRKLNS